MPLSLFTPWYRFRIHFLRYVHLRDIIHVGMAAITGLLAISTYSEHPQRVTALGIIYFVLLLFGAQLTFFRRESNDRIQAELLWGLFGHMNKQIFHDSAETRLTLFITSPLHPDYLVPWYRFQRGAQDPIAEAQRSRARYKRGEGFTGKAWDKAGGKLFCGILPKFKARDDFEQYYVYELGIDRETVTELSDFMIHVRTIFSYGFTDNSGRLLGVLSLDLREPLGGTFDHGFRVDPQELNTHDMALIILAIQSVLQSLNRARRRR